MDTEIWVTIIGSATTIVVLLLTWLLNRKNKKEDVSFEQNSISDNKPNDRQLFEELCKALAVYNFPKYFEILDKLMVRTKNIYVRQQSMKLSNDFYIFIRSNQIITRETTIQFTSQIINSDIMRILESYIYNTNSIRE